MHYLSQALEWVRGVLFGARTPSGHGRACAASFTPGGHPQQCGRLRLAARTSGLPELAARHGRGVPSRPCPRAQRT